MKNINNNAEVSNKDLPEASKSKGFDLLKLEKVLKSEKKVRLSSVESSKRVGAVNDKNKSDYWSLFD